MASLPTETLQQIATIWRRLSAPGRIAVAATMLLAVGGIVAVVFWARTPSYVVLETGLEPTRASKMTDVLRDEGIAFETRNGSTTLLVPAQDVSRARLLLAGQNLIQAPGSVDEEPSSPWDGENEKRAKQLRRTQATLAHAIASFDGIDSASVYIAPGNDSPYKSQQRPPTAAVHVKPSPGHTIGPGQVRGIVATVARAVSGMSEENVTVNGADGRALTRPQNGDDLFAGTDPMSFSAGVEEKLTQKVRNHLDRVVGPGRYTVAVSVEMNFDRTSTKKTTYDERNRVLRMRKSDKKTTPQDIRLPDGIDVGADYEPPKSKEEQKTEEYEVPETVTTEEKLTPEIVKISASVTVDEKAFTGDPNDLEEALARAIGIDEQRGDALTVKPIAFAEIEYTDAPAAAGGFEMDGVLDIAQYAAAGLVGLGLLMFFRSVLRTRPSTTTPAKVGGQIDLTVDDDELPEEQVSPKVLERKKLKKEIARAIDQDPRGVAKLVEMWLDEEGA